MFLIILLSIILLSSISILLFLRYNYIQIINYKQMKDIKKNKFDLI